ncbi:MAG: DUF2867 domain-containing protein [Pseudomonadota bacterium]
MAAITEVTPNLDPDILPGADWGDAYEAIMAHPFATAREAGDCMGRNLPGWMQPMLKLRDGLTSLAGLKGTDELRAQADAGMDAVAFFPIISETDERLVVGTDDKHFDFRLVLELDENGSGQQVLRMTTLLKRHNFGGRAYLAVIMPFHREACRGSLKNMAAERAGLVAA